MSGAALLLGIVTLQRFAELVFARQNTRRLLDAGAIEHGAGHYPLLVGFHAAWLAGLWWAGWDRALWPPAMIAFAVLQVGRAWVLLTLGRRWTTRILTVPGESLVARGPYRWVRHPNYVVVAAEIAVVPLALGLPGYAAGASLLHAGVLWVRIRAENEALGTIKYKNTM